MFSKISIPVFILSVFMFAGCRKANEYPIEPIISFKSLTPDWDPNTGQEHATVVISFTDGDGDIGWDESNLQDNFFVECFMKINNVWIDTASYNGRIKPLIPEGKNKSIRGDISYFMFSIPYGVNKTIRYEIYMYDRALHRSNTITTSELIINNP
ncbi:MAG TPA: hypothetical protein VI757_11960 [Bacteroidia bacterium]|nr:hypothetical protein [Bacteroidia bacterium]